jgi:tetratricopeptide (TPR) repeat protein
LAQQAEDIEYQLECLDVECEIANSCGDPYWILEVVRKARDITGFISMGLKPNWIFHEAWAYYSIGNLSRALEICTQAEKLVTVIGMEDSAHYLDILWSRANVLWRKSEYLEARQLYSKIVEKTSPTCSPQQHAHALCSIAAIDLLGMEGEVATIISSLNAAEPVYVVFGSPRILMSSWLAAMLKLHLGDIENARATLLECLSKSRGVFTDISHFCLAPLADPATRMHGTSDTFRWAVVYLAFVQKTKDAVGTPQALRRLADIHMAMGDEETALYLFHTALEAGTKMDIHRLRAECMVGIGDIKLRRGDLVQAKEMWAASRPLFIRSSRMKDAGLVEKRLEQLTHTRQNNSHSQDGNVESTTVPFTTSHGDTATVQ